MYQSVYVTAKIEKSVWSALIANPDWWEMCKEIIEPIIDNIIRLTCKKAIIQAALITIVEVECLPKLQHRPRGNPEKKKTRVLVAFWSPSKSLKFRQLSAKIVHNL